MDTLVGERASVRIHRTRGEDDAVGLAVARLQHGELLGHTPLDASRGKADLE